jgi:hypothetical protein
MKKRVLVVKSYYMDVDYNGRKIRNEEELLDLLNDLSMDTGTFHSELGHTGPPVQYEARYFIARR